MESEAAGASWPGKHPELIVWQRDPDNAETPPHLLGEHDVTPQARFYVRSHGPVPALDPEAHVLHVIGGTAGPVSLTVADLRARYPERRVMAALQCAGNRRAELEAVRPIPAQIPWGPGVVGNAWWSGAALADVLADAGVDPAAAHVAFEGADGFEAGSERGRYGGSIPLAKALRHDVLLAWTMNGEPLAPAHGAPLRVVVPGYVGARSVKWLTEVRLQRVPSDNYFQARSYRLFPPEIGPQDMDPSLGIELGELSVNSVILCPPDGATLEAGPVRVAGYATAGGERWVERVDVSADGGASWTTARLEGERAPWRWTLWSAELDLAPGEHRLVARAWDSSANTQPEALAPVWNVKGYMNTAWSSVGVRVASTFASASSSGRSSSA